MKEEKSTKKGIKFCPKCGTPIKKGSLFCENCGFELSKGEGKVKDLAEKLERGEATPKEAHKELEKRGLVESERWEIIPWVIYIILEWPLNIIFSDQLPVIHFPPIVIYISAVLAALGMLLAVWVTRMHYKGGGLGHDETIILFKKGIYGVVRHPGVLGFMPFPILLPIIISPYVPFTPLSVAAIIIMFVYLYYGVYLEEKMDIEKWGDEYRQYMKEVPRFNFIKGLWNLRKNR